MGSCIAAWGIMFCDDMLFGTGTGHVESPQGRDGTW